MCGRYTLAKSQQELSERFGIRQTFLDLKPRYNIAPAQRVPVIIRSGPENIMESCRWGLVPAWAKEIKTAKLLINARAETLLEKSSFKTAVRAHRCLVPADGFYDWKTAGSLKRPYFIHRVDRAVFAFAGIFTERKNELGELTRTFSIITVQANKIMSALHERMPVILPAEAEALWLDPAFKNQANILSLLRPCTDELITMHEVSARVNSVKNDNAELIEPSASQLGLNFN